MNTLYRIYNGDNELLYVGASLGVGERIRQHSHTQPWWDEVVTITLEQLDTWQELLRAETTAIKAERPRYNEIHAHKSNPWLVKPRRKRGEGSVYRRNDGRWFGAVSYFADGKRYRRTVSSNNRQDAERKFAQLKAEVYDRRTYTFDLNPL